MISLLGQGGMGEVWRAEHVLTGRPVALKLLRNALVHRPDMRRRFLREARAAAAVNHPNVVEILDAFELEDGSPALVMPLLEGETLAALIARQAPLTLAAALEVLLPLISAVGAAHLRGIVHRDLKPENVFLVRGEGSATVKVLDFGIAKLMGGTDSETLTGTGTLVGTPCYMAPEQGFGERDQDHRVDIWAIGVIAYESLAACKPIDGDNIAQIVRSLLTQGITPLEVVAPGLPQSVNDLVMSMLSRERAERPQTLREVYESLQAHAEGGTPAFAATFESNRPPLRDVDHDELLPRDAFAFAPTLDATPVAPVTPVAARAWLTSTRLALLIGTGALGLAGSVAIWGRADTEHLASTSQVPLPSTRPVASASPSTVTPPSSVPAAGAAVPAPDRSAPPATTAAPRASAPSRTAPPAAQPPPGPSAKVADPPKSTASAVPGGLQEEPPF